MAGAHREVVTLQLGHYASSVGTHWWNLQDAALCYDFQAKQQDPDICYNVMFRTGVTPSGQETYTPRLILMDLKGSLNCMKQDGNLYSEEKTSLSVAWEGIMTTHQEETPAKNSFLKDLTELEGERFGAGPLKTSPSSEACSVPWEPSSINKEAVHSRSRSQRTGSDSSRTTYQLESGVHFWSDYLRLQLHPKTVFTVHRYEHEGNSNRLEAFGQGVCLLDDPAYLEELEDRLHFFTEECDYLQGFQVLCDLHDGFSGVGVKVTEILHDEYPGKGVLTWGTSPAVHADKSPVLEVYRLLNSVLAITDLSNHSSLFCPLSLSGGLGRRPGPPPHFPHVLYDASLNYHSSAVLAAALETLSIPYRLQTSPLTMGQLTDGLSFSGRKVATAWASVPFPIRQSSSLRDTLSRSLNTAPWEPISCVQRSDGQCFAQSVVLRGIPPEIWNSSSHHRWTSPTDIYQTHEDLLVEFLQSLYPETLSASHVISSPCRVATPYPQFFSPDTNQQGFILDQRVSPPQAVKSIPVLTSLQSSSVLGRALRGLYEDVHGLDVRRWASYFTGGLELENYQEALHDLQTLAQCYKGSVGLEESEEDSD